MSELEEQTIYTCLTQCRNIALVGVSPKQELAAHEVMQYLLQHNYKVFPINPKYQGEDILGQKVYADILDVPEVIDMIDVFRPSREALEVTKKAIKAKIPYVWLQLGIENQEAKKLQKTAELL